MAEVISALYCGQQFHSAANIALCKNIFDVRPDGIHAEEVFFSDLAIGQAGQQIGQYLHFFGAERIFQFGVEAL